MVERSRLIEAYLEVLRSVIRDQAARARLGPGTSVIDSGLVDSFALADVIDRIERAIGVPIPIERMAPGDFDTAELLADRLLQLGIVG